MGKTRATLWVLVLLAATAFGFGFVSARSDPVVRHFHVPLSDWPRGKPAVRAVLISDLHFCTATMPSARVARLNRRLRALRSDIVLLAGDYAAGLKGAPCAAAGFAPLLKGLQPPLGIVAAMGNHDNWSDPKLLRRALQRAGARTVENGAVRAGPLILAVSGDTTSGRAKLGGAINAARRLVKAQPGPIVYVSHSPDIVRWLPPGPQVLLAGHTHCGQVVLPLVGALFEVSEFYGNRLRCGVVRMGEKTVIVTAGVGTSHLPIRLGAPPDLWLVTFGPSAP